ncbi:hypothetical protein [Veillonella sp. R32]|uniref:hypothetical protein n=1 Tax=Veillonella sp. R32 TaxID=2021312 RepID=UPI0013894FC2|nr:hypothetical protein [Veillonella sp. R32]KAF1682591.1 hypothetical protein VER_05135 [Veillonella sp. R32]
MKQYMVSFGRDKDHVTNEVFNTIQERDDFCFNLINDEKNEGLVINVFEIQGEFLFSHVVTGGYNLW